MADLSFVSSDDAPSVFGTLAVDGVVLDLTTATGVNFQMRAIAKVLEDHGVNMVFNGHEHNYQRTLPLRALPGFAVWNRNKQSIVIDLKAQAGLELARSLLERPA